jgi:tetratricopeptide (TPR) repeat protein
LASDATAHRAVAITLYNNKHYDEAKKHFQKSLEKCDNDLDKFSTLLEQATIEFYFTQKSSREESDVDNGPNLAYQAPYETIQEAMRIRPASQDNKTNNLTRRALALLGKCQWQLCKYSECVASVENVRNVQTGSLVTGEVLSLIPSSLYTRGPEGHTQLIEKLQSWDIVDRLAWLTYEHDYADERNPHRIFQHVTKEGGKEDFMVNIYEKVIKYLELRNSAGYVRNSLADFYWHVRQNPDKAKELWLKVSGTGLLAPFVGLPVPFAR